MARLLTILVLLSACSEETPRTQVMVEVSADQEVRALTETVRLSIFGRDAAEDFPTQPIRTLDVDLAARPFPFTHALQPLDGDVTRFYKVNATALDAAGAPVAHVLAISNYLRGRTLVLSLHLHDACIGREPCPDSQTCTQSGQCRFAARDPRSLCDLGSCDLDAGTPDGGADAEVDVPPLCLPEMCDDGVECTRDECDGDECVSIPDNGRCPELPGAYCDPFLGCQTECSAENCFSTPCLGATCGAEGCEYTEVVCADDDNVCTEDYCDPVDGCVNAPVAVGAPCTDANYCNGEERCGMDPDGAFVCLPGTPPCAPCNNTAGACGCSTDADCPDEVRFGPCEPPAAPLCSSAGVQTITTQSFTCSATAVCQVGETVVSEGNPCVINTDGNRCGVPRTRRGPCTHATSDSCTQHLERSTRSCTSDECRETWLDAGFPSCTCPDAGTDAGMDSGTSDSITMDGGVRDVPRSD